MVRARCIVQCTFAHPWWRTIKPETKNNTWTRTGYNTRTSRSAQQTSAGVRKRHIQRRGKKIKKIHRENPTSNDMKTRTRKRGATSAMKREKEREKTMSCGTAARKMHYIRNTSAFTILRIMSLGCVCVCVCVWVSAFFCMLVFQLNFSLLTLSICDILCKIICLFIRLLSASIAIFSHW